MIDIENRVTELYMEGLCCSQIIVSIGLELQGKTNPDLVKAMRGLCNGLDGSQLCGTLLGGVCMLSLFGEEQVSSLEHELIQWFHDNFDSMNCKDLLVGNDESSRTCGEIIVETCAYCVGMLEDKGLLNL